MPRTVVPPVRWRGPGGPGSAGGDGFPERLVKYVPAETLAFFVPLAAVLDPGHRLWLITVLVVGAVGTVGYLWLAGQQAGPDERPLPHFYALSCVAFLCWAVGTAAASPGWSGSTGSRPACCSGSRSSWCRCSTTC
jgi:hypothetical protein